jgi:hypothetical protein
MPLRGQIYFSRNMVLPPGQHTPHQFIIVSPNGVLANNGNRVFANVVLIRSATHQDGTPVRLVPGHSVPVTPQDIRGLANNSIIETHQIFALSIGLFQAQAGRPAPQPVAVLAQPLLDRVLENCRRLFM